MDPPVLDLEEALQALGWVQEVVYTEMDQRILTQESLSILEIMKAKVEKKNGLRSQDNIQDNMDMTMDLM